MRVLSQYDIDIAVTNHRLHEHGACAFVVAITATCRKRPTSDYLVTSVDQTDWVTNRRWMSVSRRK